MYIINKCSEAIPPFQASFRRAATKLSLEEQESEHFKVSKDLCLLV